MSKFMVHRGEESSSESEKESEEHGEEEAPQSRFTHFKFESSSESEEEHRTIKTMKDKRIDAFKLLLKEITNHTKINDFSALLDDFGNLGKELEKSKQWVEQEGIPMLYVKGLVIIEDCVNETDRKSLSTLQLRAWNTLKNRLKKHNKDYEDKIAEYRKNPIATDEEAEEKPAEKEEESEEQKASEKSKDEEAEESEEKSVKDEEEESSSEEEEQQDRSKMTPEERRRKWVRKVPEKKPEIVEEEEEDKPEGEKKEVKQVELKETVIRDKEEIKFEINDDNIRKYLVSINEKRGRSGYDPVVYVRNLTKLLTGAKDLEVRIDLLISLLKIRHEATQIVGDSVVTLAFWNETCENIFTFFRTLKECPTYVLKESITDDPKESTEESGVDYKVQANTLSYLEMLDKYLTIGLKGEEPKSAAYIIWLKNEVKLLELAEEVMIHYKTLKILQAQVRVALILMDRLHYKHDSLLKIMREKGSVVTKKEYYLEENMKAKIESLATLVYEHGYDTQKILATLYHIFHHALHGRFHEGRDLFIYSRMSQQHLSDPKPQIHYNRALVQLGIAAFQCGYTEHVIECLGDIAATSRLKELLAQGVSGRKDKSAKQDQEEAKKLLPYHTHLNIDLIESAYLISAMLVEVPVVSKQRHTIMENAGARHFRKVMQDFERRNVLGIPYDNVKDHIARAAHRLQEGDWQECYNLIEGMNIWRLQTENKQDLLAALKEKIKEAGLLAYVHMSLSQYNSYSIPILANMFDISEASVERILSRVRLL